MLGIRLLVADINHRMALETVIGADPDLSLTGSGASLANSDEAFETPCATDVIVVDLALPAANQARFWAEIHVIFPWARLVALTPTPIIATTIQAALHAGAYFIVEWSDDAERLLCAIRAAGNREIFIPLGAVLNAMMNYFDGASMLRGLVRIGDVYLDMFRRHLRRERQITHLTRREFDLLVYLIGHAGCVFSSEQLYEYAWNSAPQGRPSVQAVKSVVMRLRRKLEVDPTQPRYLISTHGHGYVIPEELVGM